MRESDILASTYNDLMNVIRYEEVEDESHLSEMKEVVKYLDVACELDKESTAYLTGDIASVVADYTIFTRPNIDVLEGDKLIITHLGRTYEGEAGLPFKYPSHLEVPVSIKERV